MLKDANQGLSMFGAVAAMAMLDEAPALALRLLAVIPRKIEEDVGGSSHS
jgi:hypothetical protein